MGEEPRFLLLDPPSGAEFCRRGSLREKTDAQNAPFPNIDLILLSGAIREAGFTPYYLNAQLNRVSWPALAVRLKAERPAGILSLVSSSSIDVELAALGRLKSELGPVRVCIVGTIILQREPQKLNRILRENSWLDGVILNPAENELTRWLRGEFETGAEPLNIAVQGPSGPILPKLTVRYGDGLRLPRPEHSIFLDRRYCLPQSKRGPVTCMQFSFGCPFTCEFCIDNQLYRKMLHRDVDDVVEEMVEADRLGFREVYFKDLTFALHKSIATEFLMKLAARRLRLRWLCTTRVDVPSIEMLTLMKRAGCYGIEFGVEHAREETRKRIDKRIKDNRIHEVFRDCRRLGIETTAFIMLAFEDDTEQDVRDTIRFARSLRPNYVSFNVVNALPGTAYEERARREGFLRDEASDYGFTTSNIRHRHLQPEQVARLRREALRSFYLDPGILAERILRLRSWFELKKLVRLGLSTAG